MTARIDALSAIYAAWAQGDHDVQWFRNQALVARDTPEFRAWMDKEGPYPEHRLLAPEEVAQWVADRHNALDADGDGDKHVSEIITRSRTSTNTPTVNLWYIADRKERALTVDGRSVLGDLAVLADKLAERYRWRPSEAATFVLTGRTPEVFVYVGSAQIRHGETAANTRVTMTLDPFLTPEQVATTYAELKAQIQPDPPPRSMSVKQYRLAEHVGPHVRSYVDWPARVTRPGRPRRPGPTGLAHFIDPVNGHTWQSLRHEWNLQYGQQAATNGRTWRYDSDSNFIRDSQHALRRLLFTGWKRPDDTDPQQT